MVTPAALDDIAKRLHSVGLQLRGRALNTDEFDLPGQSLILIGNIGGTFWKHFQAAKVSGANPLDDWVKSIVRPIASEHNAVAYFPSDQPYQPFQQWAMKAEGIAQSVLGPLIHSEFGTWHAYRAALVMQIDESYQDVVGSSYEIDSSTSEIESSIEICQTCLDKPCLSKCPVKAFRNGTYDVESCAFFLEKDEGKVCMSSGCQARIACPVGTSFTYSEEQNEFHLTAFLNARKAV